MVILWHSGQGFVDAPFAEVDPSPTRGKQLCGGNQAAVEKMLQFGRELQGMSVQLCREYGKNEANKKALQVCDQKEKERKLPFARLSISNRRG